MKKLREIILIIFLIICVFCITACSKEKMDMEGKIESEIDFCENRILIFLKKCEYDEFLKDGSLDWKSISEENTTFTDSFPTIEADLTSANIDNGKLNEIKSIIQNMNNYSQNNDIDKLKNEYGNLYTKMTSIKNNKNRDLKNICMQIYMMSINNNQDALSSLISKLENDFNSFKQDKDFIELNKFSLERISNNISDIKSAIDTKDYIKVREHCLKILEIM